MTSVKAVDDNRPPITTVAKGLCTSAPAEVEMAIGKKPSAAAEAVNNTGRKRLEAAFLITSFRSSLPDFNIELNSSIRTIPFSTAIPNKAINPTPAEILNGISLR